MSDVEFLVPYFANQTHIFPSYLFTITGQKKSFEWWGSRGKNDVDRGGVMMMMKWKEEK